MSRAILAVVAIWLLISPALPQERTTFTVPFHIINSLILLDGQLNGKATAFLLDTGANNSVADYRAAGFDDLKLDALRSTGSAGAEGARVVREVKLRLASAVVELESK